MPDCTPYFTTEELSKTWKPIWHLDRNESSEFLVAVFHDMSNDINLKIPIVLVFSGFDSPKFIRRVLLPESEHIDISYVPGAADVSFKKCRINYGGIRMIITDTVPRTSLLVTINRGFKTSQLGGVFVIDAVFYRRVSTSVADQNGRILYYENRPLAQNGHEKRPRK